MIKPVKIQKGDTVATISPSWGCAGSARVRWEYDLGCDRLRSLGLNVVPAPNSLKGTAYLKANPEARADDINWAFENKDVKAIIANIGGNDAELLLPYLSESIIRNNPKIFCGYSDVMVLHLFCLRQGLITYYGDNLLTNVAENPEWHSYSKYWFERVFFETEEIGKIEPSEDWSYDHCKHTDKDYRKHYIPNQGYIRIQGEGIAEGELFGGHGEIKRLSEVYGKTLIRKEEFEDSIFFFEDIPECCSPEQMAEFFDWMGQKGYLQILSGIIIGKMRTPNPFEPYAQKLMKVITDKYQLPKLPVLGGLNFGHTSPVCILPYGAKAKIDMDNMSFDIIESGVSS